MGQRGDRQHNSWRQNLPLSAAIGWIPLGGAYLHVGDTEGQVIEVVSLAIASMAGANVLWFE